MVGIYITAALTPAVLWIGRRLPISRKAWVRPAALHFLFSCIFSVVEIALETIVFLQLGLLRDLFRGSFATAFPLLLVAGFHENVITYWAVIGIQSGLRYYRQYQERELRASELEAQLTRSQLSTLKMQLRPHFLFNTLNTIMSLVRERKGAQAEEMLSRLSDLLRFSLEEVDAHEAPLRRELEYLRLYLSIEEVRFEDRLRVEVAADPEVLDAAVPHMALQPIVENAVRHGIGKSMSGGKIGIRATRVNGALEIKIEDDGPGLQTASPEESRGIGLGNTRARLARLYGAGAHLTVRDGEHGGVVVTMVVPYRSIDEVVEHPITNAHGTDNPDR